MFMAAIPVLAVVETSSKFFLCFFRRAAMIALRSSDFPVPIQRDQGCLINHLRKRIPAAPVKNTLFPSFTAILSTLICSSFSVTCSCTISPSGCKHDVVACGVKNASSVFRGCFAGLILPSSMSPVDFLFFVFAIALVAAQSRAKSGRMSRRKTNSRGRCPRRRVLLNERVTVARRLDRLGPIPINNLKFEVSIATTSTT